MNSVLRRFVTSVIIIRNCRARYFRRSLHNLNCDNANITSTLVNISSQIPYHNSVRLKSKKRAEIDSDDEDIIDGDSSLSRDSKVVKFSTTSLRTDTILKSALGIARNKIEKVFYESKIRLNGKKILKKSVSVKIGDEIDIIKAVSATNPNHINVSRVEILNITAEDESITVAARRFKNLLIENYKIDPFKGNADPES